MHGGRCCTGEAIAGQGVLHGECVARDVLHEVGSVAQGGVAQKAVLDRGMLHVGCCIGGCCTGKGFAVWGVLHGGGVTHNDRYISLVIIICPTGIICKSR